MLPLTFEGSWRYIILASGEDVLGLLHGLTCGITCLIHCAASRILCLIHRAAGRVLRLVHRAARGVLGLIRRLIHLLRYAFRQIFHRSLTFPYMCKHCAAGPSLADAGAAGGGQSVQRQCSHAVWWESME